MSTTARCGPPRSSRSWDETPPHVRRRRPSGMRAWWLRRLAQGGRQFGHGLGLAHLGGIVRRVLLAAQRLTGELDEMVGDEAHAEHGVDLAAAERVPRGAPERFAVVR